MVADRTTVVIAAMALALNSFSTAQALDASDLPTGASVDAGQRATPAAPTAPLPTITGSSEVDRLIRSLAEDRGYVSRPLASVPLEGVDGHLLEPEAATAWTRLRTAAADAGHHLRLVSAFRDHETQRSLFLGRLRGHSAAAIESCLAWTAPPGYSKHHTGLAIDITVSGRRGGSFAGTPAYAWLSDNEYHNAKRFGFLPSYPPDGPPEGPNPEPWEWVYVGRRAIVAGGTVAPPSPGLRRE